MPILRQRQPCPRHRDGVGAFRALDLKEMASIMTCPVIVDLSAIYSPEEVMRNGFHYCGVGRPKSLAYRR